MMDMNTRPVETQIKSVERIGESAAQREALSLLGFYKVQCEKNEQDMFDLLKKIEVTETSQEELHLTKWNVHKCEECIHTLQRALSDANVLLHEERVQSLRLQSENEQLRIQELEDRRRIQHLLALTQPVASDVTFFKDCRPSTMTRYPGGVSAYESTLDKDGLHHFQDNGLSLSVNLEPKVFIPGDEPHLLKHQHIGHSHQMTGRNCSKSSDRIKSKAKVNQSCSRTVNSSTCSVGSRVPTNHSVLKTVYLPNEKVDTLLLTIDNLRNELDQLKVLSKQQIDALLNDRQQTMANTVEREQRFSESLKNVEEQLKDDKAKLTHMTKDYLLLRYNSQKAQRAACEQIEESKQVQKNAVESLAGARAQMMKGHNDLKEASVEEHRLSNEFAQKREMQHHEEMNILREQSATVQKAYKNRITELEKRLSWLREKYRTLEKRRNLEFEGFRNDVLSVRKQIEIYEHSQYHAQKLATTATMDNRRDEQVAFKTNKIFRSKNRSKNGQPNVQERDGKLSSSKQLTFQLQELRSRVQDLQNEMGFDFDEQSVSS